MRKSKILIALIMIVAVCSTTLIAFVGCADVGKLSVISAQYETTDEGQLWQFKIHWEYGEEVPHNVDIEYAPIKIFNSLTKKYTYIVSKGYENLTNCIYFDSIEEDEKSLDFAFTVLL